MRTITSLLFAIAALVACRVCAAEPIPREPEILREAAKGDVSALEWARKMPVAEAESMLREAGRRFDRSQPEVARAAHRLLGDLPGMSQYYEQGLAELPLLHENTEARSAWISVLKTIPKRWALELLAKQLDDQRPLTSSYDEATLEIMFRQTGSRSASNAQMAAAALARRYSDKIPLPKIPWHSRYSETELLKVKRWWDVHKDEPDSYFFDEKAWGADIAASIKSPEQKPSRKNSNADEPNASASTPGGETTPPPWSIVVALGLALLGLVWLILQRRG